MHRQKSRQRYRKKRFTIKSWRLYFMSVLALDFLKGNVSPAWFRKLVSHCALVSILVYFFFIFSLITNTKIKSRIRRLKKDMKQICTNSPRVIVSYNLGYFLGSLNFWANTRNKCSYIRAHLVPFWSQFYFEFYPWNNWLHQTLDSHELPNRRCPVGEKKSLWMKTNR